MPYYRMAQCRSVKITITDEAVPVQVDGEPWMQPPGVIKIVHKNRAQMLVRDAEFESTLKSWTDIQQEKHEKHYLSEEENMKQMVFSLRALIK
ncbi:diacylglycerol kinase delta-like, partial [Paramuricea clavata]